MLPEKNEAEQNTEETHENSSLELLAGRISAFQVSPGSKLGSKKPDFRISDCALYHSDVLPESGWLPPQVGYSGAAARNFCLYSYR